MNERRIADYRPQPARHRPNLPGPLPRLQGVRAVLRAAVPWALLAILPWLWAGGTVDVVAQNAQPPALNGGPASETYSVYWYQLDYDPVFGPPCNDLNIKNARNAFGAGAGGQVSVTCAHDDPPTLIRYVALITGPRCQVTWRGREVESRPCVSLPILKN